MTFYTVDDWNEAFSKHLLGGGTPEDLDEYLLELRTRRDRSEQMAIGNEKLRIAQRLYTLLETMKVPEESIEKTIEDVVGKSSIIKVSYYNLLNKLRSKK